MRAKHEHEHEREEPQFDPSYSSDDADLIVRSSDGIRFRVHSTILKVASGFFQDMLSLPQSPELKDNAEPLADIAMDERKEVLKAFLDAIYPDSTTVLAEALDFETFRDLMFILTHKYELVAGEKIAKGLLNDKRLTFSPVLMFGVMQHIGWEDEALALSAATLEYNLLLEEYQKELRRLPSESVLDLLHLHQMRKRAVLDVLESAAWCNLEPDSKCEEHKSGLCYQPVWYAFKHVVMEELERKPSGIAFKVKDTCCLPAFILDELKKTKVYCPICSPERVGHTLTWSNFCNKLWLLIDNLPKHFNKV